MTDIRLRRVRAGMYSTMFAGHRYRITRTPAGFWNVEVFDRYGEYCVASATVGKLSHARSLLVDCAVQGPEQALSGYNDAGYYAPTTFTL